MSSDPLPRLCSGVAIVTTLDALIVEGGPRRQRFTGGSVAVLGTLLPLIDGTRTPAELAQLAGLQTSDVAHILMLLRRAGLLELVTRPPGQPSAAAAYFSRSIDAAPGYASAEDLAAVLGDAVVLVAAGAEGAEVAEAIVLDLKASGVGNVILGDAVAELPEATTRLVIGEAGPDLAGIVQACRKSNVTILCFAVGEEQLEIGPLNELPPTPISRHTNDALGQIMAGLVVAEALAVLTRWVEPPPAAVLTTYELPSLERHRLVSFEGSVFDGYEQLIGSRSPAPTESYNQAQQQRSLGSVRPDFPTAPRVRLEPASAGGLGAILSMVAGRRSVDEPQRWAPSGGNVGATELYVVVNGEVGGWPAGTLFRYDDLSHELIVPRADNDGLSAWLADTPWSENPPSVLLFFVTAVQRLAKKYGRFAYRLGHLDAGCALAQLAAVAALHGLHAEIAPACSRAHSERMELEPGHEFVAAVAALHGKLTDADR